MDVKEHILTETDALFCKYGIKSVTMDDIARHLGISKKTIYHHFEDKNQLVYTLIDNRTQAQSCEMDDLSLKAENAIHEFILAVTHIQGTLSNLNPNMFYDLQKYHPEAWQLFKEFKEKRLYTTIRANIERGIREGLYRTDLNIDLLSRLRVQQLDLCLSPGNLAGPDYSIVQVMTEFTFHFMYGLSNPEGHRLITAYRNLPNE